jgi:type II secretory pathway component PulF
MKTNVLDSAILGTSIMAGLSNFLDNYGGFLITAGSALLIGYIRLQEHRKNMELLDLDIEAKRKELNL